MSIENAKLVPDKDAVVSVLVHIDFPTIDDHESAVEEFRDLAVSAGAEPAALVRATRNAPTAKYFVGKGKAEDIAERVALHGAELVLFNHALTPSQERNLETLLKCRVLDRSGLILDIFAQRARTHEGKLQVELAQLQHLSTRLIRGWTHLERQKGGLGLRGPGETQLETDRRLIGQRIKTISKRLEKVRKQRSQSRRARQRSAVPTVALVGYTNAGKSTFFNRITHSDVYAASQPFATLDPTLRRLELPGAGAIIFADTVGFIRELPHELVAAFRATLEEVREADLLLHIVDASSSDHDAYLCDVNAVLKEIGAENVPQLLIYNKIDLLENETARIDVDGTQRPTRVWLSALTGEGEALFVEALGKTLHEKWIECSIILSPEQAKLRAQLYELGAILNEAADESGGWQLQVRLTRQDYDRLLGFREK